VEIHFWKWKSISEKKDVESESKRTREEMNKIRCCGVLNDIPVLIQVNYIKS
jgi:hypothetical protein